MLTPKQANPLTGVTSPVVGWQFTSSTIADVYQGCNVVFQAGFVPKLGPVPGNTAVPPLWGLAITKGGVADLIVQDTDYFVFDGFNVRVVTQADAQANYTVAPQ